MNKKNYSLIFIVIPLLIGSLIYIFFRNDSLNVFKWISYVRLEGVIFPIRDKINSLNIILPSFILYSLPDGIWVFVGSNIFLLIWKDNIKNGIIWILLPFVIGIASEMLQLIKIINGTFSLCDILSYVGALIASLLLNWFIWRKR